ncbi:hypothetical protein LRS13_03415 [Svornostia abyssi]|uniref:PucR-like N-terminal domain-containing protein n=1 Tax=Svornostia abyssi TaxID=2898438 RepID=A0ABY5PIW2_9ACTN|nr:hypothetical protein LRS13_03415 [Parviterribacteraceae bacterium J379]
MPTARRVSESTWPELPGELAPALQADMPTLSEEIIGAIVEEVPAYRRPLRGEFAAGIRMGVDQSLQQFVDLVKDPSSDVQAMHDTVRRLGASEQQAGRSLETLQTAYRIGARVSWHRLGRTASAAGCDPDAVQRLAEALFLYVEDLAALTVQGYAGALAEQAGEQARRRRAVADALLAEPQDPGAVADAAARAGWSVPERLAVVVIPDEATALHVARTLGPEALVTGHGGALDAGVIWPDPDGPGRAATLRRALGEAEAPAAVGPPGRARRRRPLAAPRAPLPAARRARRAGRRPVVGRRPPRRRRPRRRRGRARRACPRPARPVRRPAPRCLPAPAEDAACVAARAGSRAERRRGAARPPADRALPDEPAARAARRRPGRPRRAVRARAGAQSAGARGLTTQRPVHTGARFSKNAVMPSFMSSLSIASSM